MEDWLKSKIWKYMDLAKFVSLLTTRSLYFACPVTQFDDPYEGWLPKSHIDALSDMIQDRFVGPLLALRKDFAAKGIQQQFDAFVEEFKYKMQDSFDEATAKFGVSCWHESENESDAMWKVYSSLRQGIAIESTIGQLKESLGNREGIQIDRVRYMDFDKDPIEKRHRHYGLFLKRKSFEYEKEVRATILLREEGKGISVDCNLEVLITCIHVSPLVEGFVANAIQALCSGNMPMLNKPIRKSVLYARPSYPLLKK